MPWDQEEKTTSSSFAPREDGGGLRREYSSSSDERTVRSQHKRSIAIEGEPDCYHLVILNLISFPVSLQVFELGLQVPTTGSLLDKHHQIQPSSGKEDAPQTIRATI